MDDTSIFCFNEHFVLHTCTILNYALCNLVNRNAVNIRRNQLTEITIIVNNSLSITTVTDINKSDSIL